MAPAAEKGKKDLYKPPRKATSTGASGAASSTVSTGNIKRRPPRPQASWSSSKRPPPAPEEREVASTTTTPKRRKQKQTTPLTGPSSKTAENDESLSSEEEPEYILAEITTIDGPEASKAVKGNGLQHLDPKFIAGVLHARSFRNTDTRITNGATKLFTKYIETFAQELISRSLRELRVDTNGDQEILPVTRGAKATGQQYLACENLETAYMQIMLDF